LNNGRPFCSNLLSLIIQFNKIIHSLQDDSQSPRVSHQPIALVGVLYPYE
jgi:hypothetical protein